MCDKRKNVIDIINCNIISIVILMNSLQMILGWNFNIAFNMWIEYAFIGFLIIINKVKIFNKRNVVIFLIFIIMFLLNMEFNNSEALKYYIQEFELYSIPIIIIFLINVDIKKFCKIFLIYNIITVALYLLAIIINAEKVHEDYMTFGYYSIFSLSFVLIYSYYHKNIPLLVMSIIAIPIIIVNGNRGTILVATTAIIAMLLFSNTKKWKKIIFVCVLIIAAMNITTIVKSSLDFLVARFNISNNYSVRNLYAMIESDDTENSLGGRSAIYEEAIQEIKDNTITGMGIAGFQAKYGYFPHNIFLDIYVTFGIIIGTMYLVYIINIGIHTYKISKENMEIKILFIFMVSNIMKLMLSKTFVYDPTIWLYISLGNFINTKYRSKVNEEDNSIHTNI